MKRLALILLLTAPMLGQQSTKEPAVSELKQHAAHKDVQIAELKVQLAQMNLQVLEAQAAIIEASRRAHEALDQAQAELMAERQAAEAEKKEGR